MGGFETDASSYDRDLQRGLDLSGESKDYFADGRILRVAQALRSRGVEPQSILDYGCGAGDSLPILERAFAGATTAGADVSRTLVAEARLKNPDRDLLALGDLVSAPRAFELVYCNGVFHHIAPPERDDCLRQMRGLLQPGGWLALFENNPLNPGTRLVMSRIPFDRDAITLFHWEARARLARTGFEVVRTEFLFFFPRLLSWLRRLDPLLRSCPLGAQYLVLARKKP